MLAKQMFHFFVWYSLFSSNLMGISSQFTIESHRFDSISSNTKIDMFINTIIEMLSLKISENMITQKDLQIVAQLIQYLEKKIQKAKQANTVY